MTTARWALISAESNEESAALALQVVKHLETAGIRTAGFTQRKSMNEHGQKCYELLRLHGDERSLLAVDNATAPKANEELFCSMVFHNDSFAAARRWLEEDGRNAELLLFCGIGKLEAFNKGHSKLLERVLGNRGVLVLLCVRASQLSYVMERFELPEDKMIDALELPAASKAIDGFVENLKASCYAQFSILRATLEDSEEILALQKLAFMSEAKLYGEQNVPKQTLKSMQDDIRNQVVLKAMSGTRIVGSIRAKHNGKLCKLARLITHPDFQRRGIGTALLHAMETHFPEAECFALFTGSKSASNIRLYERLGYRRTRERVFSSALTFVHMEKRQQPKSQGT